MSCHTRVNGILNLCKPPGLTSHDVVARVRRWTGEKQAGHAGTLDPAAWGVLPVCLGWATRLVEYLAGGRKVYASEITLGITTTTDDGEGEILSQQPVSVALADIDRALAGFVGEITQRPPAYSALKQGGRPLYALARAGVAVVPLPRQVTIYAIQRVAWVSPVLLLRVTCSKGTYIRSLARDLGAALGCGGHLSGLVREVSEPFTLDDALSLEGLEQAAAGNYLSGWLQSPVVALWQYPPVSLDRRQVAQVRQGQAVALDQPPQAPRLAALAPDGELVAVLRPGRFAGQWQPEKVFPSP